MTTNIYTTSGNVIGYITAGQDANAISGIVYNSAFNGNPGNRFVIAQHTNGAYYTIKIISAVKQGNNWNFSGVVDGQVVSNFKPSITASAQAVAQKITETIASIIPDANVAAKVNDFPWWAVGAGGLGVLYLLISRQRS